MSELKGRVAFITGAANGQGRSVALTLARAGAKIAALGVPISVVHRDARGPAPQIARTRLSSKTKKM